MIRVDCVYYYHFYYYNYKYESLNQSYLNKIGNQNYVKNKFQDTISVFFKLN